MYFKIFLYIIMTHGSCFFCVQSKRSGFAGRGFFISFWRNLIDTLYTAEVAVCDSPSFTFDSSQALHNVIDSCTCFAVCQKSFSFRQFIRAVWRKAVSCTWFVYALEYCLRRLMPVLFFVQYASRDLARDFLPLFSCRFGCAT